MTKKEAESPEDHFSIRITRSKKKIIKLERIVGGQKPQKTLKLRAERIYPFRVGRLDAVCSICGKEKCHSRSAKTFMTPFILSYRQNHRADCKYRGKEFLRESWFLLLSLCRQNVWEKKQQKADGRRESKSG
ncbi:hypothetical protein NPIL_171951 [Nephila pilipes]|uniref:Uncharacterized protein n=1 Tax=Nephila pilipes TaxID=299642 RepID=A0A8X6NN28_NEPPI|nr:hypothetical protein NPIL_171951 [Nephila pilipes]